MNLAEYGRILLQRGWIMVLLAVLTAAGAFALSQFVTPVLPLYTAGIDGAIPQ